MDNNTFNNILNNLLTTFNDKKVLSRKDSLWANFITSGVNLWLDTGDIVEAKKMWNNNFTALTTNNTLLNKEVQKGIYDNIIEQVDMYYKEINTQEKVKEIALFLNALHGLRLVKIFNAKVSVELHTDLANDIDGIVFFGTKLYNINPDHFIIKVPFTAAGLIGAKKLHDKGIPVNMTLQFSARQNVFSALIAQSVYSNVFLGRIGAFLKNNNLGKPDNIGEKVTSVTQYHLNTLRKEGSSNTKLIAASIRSWSQLLLLQGIDVFTIPIQAVKDAKENIPTNGNLKFNDIMPIELYDNINIEQIGLNKFWTITKEEFKIAQYLSQNIPSSGKELERFLHDNGCRDIFPILSEDEHNIIDTDGKIPVYKHWDKKIKEKTIGIDTLLNQAGLAAFKADQQALDNRIRSKLGV